jgi:PPOX class probable F420-dependent enzyme
MGRMKDSEWQAFVADGQRVAVLATARRGDRTHAVPVWFVLDGDEILFTTPAASVKGRTIQRTGRATMLIMDHEPPYSFAMIEGLVDVSRDAGVVHEVTIRVHERYLPPEQAAQAAAPLLEEPTELACRLRPDSVFAIDNVIGTFQAQPSVQDW